MAHPVLGVVGAGRVGTTLAAKFRAAGYPIVGVAARSHASRLRAQTMLAGIEVMDPAQIAERSDVLILAVPDDQLAAIAADLAPHTRPGQVVLHTSGRHGLTVLSAMTDVRPIAFHPAMTFTGTEVDLDRSCVFGLTAADEDRALAEELVAALGGSPMWIAEGDRVRYHASLAHGANNITTIVGQAMDVLRSIGAEDPAAVLRPLLEATVSNTLAYGDAALTGPVARGDVGTVRAHLDALSADGADRQTRDSYRALAIATAQRAGQDAVVEELVEFPGLVELAEAAR